MRNLLQYLVRYSNFLLFMLLEVVAFILASAYNRNIESTVWSAANRYVAGVEQIQTSISDYFDLKEQNRILATENALLQEQLMALHSVAEPAVEMDSAYIYPHLDWHFIPAKIIGGSLTKQHNYMVLNKGQKDGIREDMGVTCHQGVVGIVSAVGSNYSIVVPLIHTGIHLSCRILNNQHLVTTQWEGRHLDQVSLMDVSRHIPLSEGDTIVTSGLTGAFPEGIRVGVVNQATIAPTDNYYTARMHLNTDYHQLRYVQVVYNPSLPSSQDSIITQANGLD